MRVPAARDRRVCPPRMPAAQVLCIGDDSADEYMFSALNDRFGSSSQQQGNRPAVFTAVVGQKPSAANYFLNDPDEVRLSCVGPPWPTAACVRSPRA